MSSTPLPDEADGDSSSVASKDTLDPMDTEMDFLDSSYFSTHGLEQPLPTPQEVRELCPTKDDVDPQPVRFEELNLIVKFGPAVSLSEAHCLMGIRRVVQDEVPVPEVYGWRVDAGEVFIYMQLIQGPTLLERWESLDESDRLSVCDDLRSMVSSLRAIKLGSVESFIGSVNGGPLPDYVFEDQPWDGPFSDVQSFNDWFSSLWLRKAPEPDKVPNPWRQLLPDNAAITLTHGDLDRSNIIVSTTSPAHVIAIINWDYCGWYPEYWEYCKAMHTAVDWEDWRGEGWIDRFLTPHEEALEAFDFYTRAMGSL